MTLKTLIKGGFITAYLLTSMAITGTFCDAMPVLDSTNSVSVNASISHIKRHNRTKSRTISVICYGDIEKYDGHEYKITLSKSEWNSWKSEQGKISKGDDVRILLYKNGTKKVTDDIVVNIRK